MKDYVNCKAASERTKNNMLVKKQVTGISDTLLAKINAPKCSGSNVHIFNVTKHYAKGKLKMISSLHCTCSLSPFLNIKNFT